MESVQSVPRPPDWYIHDFTRLFVKNVLKRHILSEREVFRCFVASTSDVFTIFVVDEQIQLRHNNILLCQPIGEA